MLWLIHVAELALSWVWISLSSPCHFANRASHSTGESLRSATNTIGCSVQVTGLQLGSVICSRQTSIVCEVFGGGQGPTLVSSICARGRKSHAGVATARGERQGTDAG